jgi:polysaccharide export outer membrane protein
MEGRTRGQSLARNLTVLKDFQSVQSTNTYSQRRPKRPSKTIELILERVAGQLIPFCCRVLELEKFSDTESWVTVTKQIGRRLVLICCLVLALSGCFGGSTVQTRVVVHPSASMEATAYTIGSDDVIDVLVWKEPQLSGRVRVASDGRITMPLIGQITAADQTTEQLQDELTEKFSKFVHNPQVTVRIFNPASRAFYALGEVVKPGRYPLMSGEVLSQALAAAGGTTEYANLRKIKIVRRTSDTQVEITVNYSAVSKGDLSADILLERSDTIMVP